MPIDYSGYATKAKVWFIACLSSSAHPDRLTLVLSSVVQMMKEPIPPRGSTGMVGLSNQGATCYLNALIQTLYMTPELRAGLFAVDPAELGVHLIEAWETEQACKASKGEVEADDNLLATLVSLGVEEAKARSALIQTKNAGLDQALEHMDRSDKVEEAAPAKRGAPKPRFIPLELQRLFSELQLADAASVSTQELTSRGFQWQSAEGRVQHDAHELNRLLIDALERSLRRTSGAALCKALYEGTLTNQVLCRQCGALSLRSEPFYDLNLQVLGMTDAVQVSQVHPHVLSNLSHATNERCIPETSLYPACVLFSTLTLSTGFVGVCARGGAERGQRVLVRSLRRPRARSSARLAAVGPAAVADAEPQPFPHRRQHAVAACQAD